MAGPLVACASHTSNEKCFCRLSACHAYGARARRHQTDGVRYISPFLKQTQRPRKTNMSWAQFCRLHCKS